MFEKAGQLDAEVENWCIDASGGLWACLRDGKLARLEPVTESSKALKYCKTKLLLEQQNENARTNNEASQKKML